ncbi:MAG: hypothetical protein HYU57_03340 [Micavibrio aeruginosavorus]|nr:hypothetical protein [Micavibrio aeruginosavorus]
MLTVTRQAATEAECEAILTASYQVDRPFSSPVLILDPLDFAPKRFLGLTYFGSALKKTVKKKLASLLPGCEIPRSDQVDDMKARGYDIFSPEQIEKAIIANIKAHFIFNEKNMALALPVLSPRFSVALHSRIKDSARVETEGALMITRPLTQYPGFDAQHNFNSLWHEIAHSVAGDNEAGADLTAALACRYVFKDCTFLHLQADLRAAHVVLACGTRKVLEDYGWACVEATETPLALNRPVSAEDVRKVGESSYRVPRVDRTDSIIRVAQSLHRAAGLAFEYRDLRKLADTAEGLLQNGAFADAEQRMIASRFALAARRIEEGAPAYARNREQAFRAENENNPVRKFLLQLIV